MSAGAKGSDAACKSLIYIGLAMPGTKYWGVNLPDALSGSRASQVWALAAESTERSEDQRDMAFPTSAPDEVRLRRALGVELVPVRL